MHFPVFLDTILRLCEADVVRPHWSRGILDEVERNLALQIGIDKARQRLARMETAFPSAMVSGHEGMVEAMANDPKDRHVLAAAVHSECEVIVTFNLVDFPAEVLKPHGLVAVSPDAFLLDQLDLYPQVVRRSLVRQSAATARPSLTLSQMTAHLERIGLAEFAAELRRRWPDL